MRITTALEKLNYNGNFMKSVCFTQKIPNIRIFIGEVIGDLFCQ